MVATQPPVGFDPVGRDWRQVWLHPAAISGFLTAAGAAIWVTVFPRAGTDLSAALARAGWAQHFPGSGYLFTWYGGISPASYSLLAPYLLAIVGTHLAMAIAAILAAILLTSLMVRYRVRHPAAAAVWGAVALCTELSAGRAAFTLGITAALGCAVVIDVSRPRSRIRLAGAVALAVLTCLLSPVAALFLVVAGAALALAGHRVRGVAIGAAAILPMGVMAFFSDGGVQPIGWNWLPSLLAAAAVLLLVGREWRAVRIGAAVYAAGIILACLVPTPVGSNVARLGELLIGPMLVGIGSARRGLLTLALIASAVWQVAQPVADLAHGAAPPTAALIRELGALHADTVRVEAVPEYGHWESQELALAVPLARGWERQIDVERDPLFYDGSFTPDAYHRWLRYNAVGYVAISTATPDPAALAEAAAVRAGQPFLAPIWHDTYWRLYRVTDAEPLASPPATIMHTTPARITLRMSDAGTAIVRIRWSPLVRAAGAVLAQDGAWTSVTVSTPGTYVLSAPY